MCSEDQNRQIEKDEYLKKLKRGISQIQEGKGIVKTMEELEKMANDTDIKKTYEELNEFTDDIFEDGRDQGMQEDREQINSQSRIKFDEPNEITYAAMNEGEQLLCDTGTERFSSIEELFEELDAE